jgi:hypothetical protein
MAKEVIIVFYVVKSMHLKIATMLEPYFTFEA